MPLFDFPHAIRPFASIVQAAAEQRFGAAATSEIVSLAAKDANISLGFSDYTGLARLYGSYVQGRETRSVVTSALAEARRTGIEQGVTGQMVWSPPWAPSVSGPAQPQYVLVRTTYSKESPEGTLTGIISHRYHVSQVQGLLQLLGEAQAQIDIAPPGDYLDGATATGIVGIERVA